MENFINFFAIPLIMTLCVLGVGWLLYKMFNKKHEKYRDTNFKTGDHVDFATEYFTDAEILDIDGDWFTIKTKIHRDNLYKRKK